MLISTISMIGEHFFLEHWQNFQTVTVTVKALRPFRSLARLRQCCRCAIAMLVQVLVVWQTCERHETFIFMHALVHTHPFLDRDWGRSCWPQQRLWFLILIPHAAVKKQWAADPHNLLSEKVTDNLAARCLQTIVWHECVRIHCRPCTSLRRKYKLVMTSRTQNLLSLVRAGDCRWAVFVNACSKPLIWNEAVNKKRGGDTRHFHSHDSVTHPLPAS